MQTIIHLTGSYTQTDNVALVVTEIKSLKEDLLTAHEIEFIRDFNKEHKKRLFTFNRLTHLVFVLIMEKERDQYTRLENYREEGAKFQPLINDHKLNAIVLADPENKPSEMLALAEGLALRNYQFLKYKTKASEKLNSLNSIYIHSRQVTEDQVDRLNILVDAASRCRDMVNEPVAWLNAERIADEMAKMGKEAGATVEVLNKKKIEALKMGGLLAVNKGSVDPPTFTIMEWKPKKAVNKKPVVLVGKGVVYDTGGMNLKTGSFMNDMKMDMAGGASVSAALYAVAKSKLNVWVIALIPATDNRTHGNAYVNGDIITMHNGSTVEVINTDAEGRMILADALSYAKKYDPELVINVATLTGSAMRAIGIYGIAAMQAKAAIHYRKLKESGERIYERIVEFPLWKEYGEELKSNVADIKHLGGANGGAITAGKFLEHFTDYPFIHLDIAGPAYLEKPHTFYPEGGTGIPVRLLYDFLLHKSTEK
jgi:leucyl aminopeptidase